MHFSLGSASTFKEIQKLKEDSLSPVAMVKGLKWWKVSTKLIITKLIITAGQHIPKRARSSLTNWDIEFEIVPMDLDNASVDDMAWPTLMTWCWKFHSFL